MGASGGGGDGRLAKIIKLIGAVEKQLVVKDGPADFASHTVEVVAALAGSHARGDVFILLIVAAS